MRPPGHSDGQAAPNLIVMLDLGKAALVDDVVTELHSSVRQPGLVHELPDILAGLSSGYPGRSVNSLILSGTINWVDACQPA